MPKDKVREARLKGERAATVAKACSSDKLNSSKAKKPAARVKANKKALDTCLDKARKL
jgi:hypothetical protein